MNSEQVLAALKYTPKEAYDIACEKGERMPELEPIIATDPYLAYYYAINIIKGRFPEAEPLIATDPEWAYNYAINIIKGRFPELESIIATNQKCKKWYEDWFNVKL